MNLVDVAPCRTVELEQLGYRMGTILKLPPHSVRKKMVRAVL